MNPQCDIILPVHDALDYTRACVESVFEHTKDFRWILVDDFSSLETTAFLLEVLRRQPTALYVRTGQQKWFTRASNIGLRLARTGRTILLNSDCVVDDGWLQELFDVWELAGTTGLKVGMVGSILSAEEPRRWGTYSDPGYVTGHCLLLSIPILAEMAEKRGQPGWYLDEVNQGCIHINSDRLLSYDMNRAGYATVASFKSAVGHHGGKSWNYDLGRVGRVQIGNPERGEVLG
jgi:GT2 family glycosyltransferase